MRIRFHLAIFQQRYAKKRKRKATKILSSLPRLIAEAKGEEKKDLFLSPSFEIKPEN